MKNDNIFTIPGGVSFSDDLTAGNNGLRSLYQVPNAVDQIERKIERVQEQIRSGFFSDLFLMISQEPTRSNVTATEIAERHEEKMLVLGPVIERLAGEFLSPAIERTLAIANRLGFLPPPPKEIRGMPMHIEYVSILAQAQKMVGIGGLQQFVAFVAQLSQVFGPQVLDQINSDQVVSIYGEMTGTDPRTLNAMEVVQAIRQQRMKEMQQQKQQQAITGAASVVKDLGSASTGPNTALSELLGRLNPSPVPAQA